MPVKTQKSQASTNPPSGKETNPTVSSSFHRQMFQQLPFSDLIDVNQTDCIIQSNHKYKAKNVLLFQPEQINSITWPQVFMPGQEIYIALKGNFYVVKDTRHKSKFINRFSKPNSQTVFFNVSKHNDNLIMVTVEKFVKANNLYYHIDITSLNMQNEKVSQASAIQVGSIMINEQVYYLQFKGIQIVQNTKKGLLIFNHYRNQKRFQIFLVDLQKRHNQEFKQQSRLLSSNFIQQKQGQQFIKIINSNYGDIVLIITNQQVYQIEITFNRKLYQIVSKPLEINKIFSQNVNTYLNDDLNLVKKPFFTQEQYILDAGYGLNSLKVNILTTYGRIFVIQSMQYILSESLYQILSNKQVSLNCNVQNFNFVKIYPLKGLLVVQVEAQKKNDCNLLKHIKHENSIVQEHSERNAVQYISRMLIVLKIQSNSLSFSKFIPLPFDLKTHSGIILHPFSDSEQLLLQSINEKSPQILQLYRCQLIANKNNFISFCRYNYIRETQLSFQGRTAQLKQQQTKGFKITISKVNRCLFTIDGNQISSFRMVQPNPNTNQCLKKTITFSFFQKPLKVVINPLSGNIVVLFKQFVKIFLNNYSQLKLIHVINVRNVADVSFSKNGEFMVVSLAENSVWLIDSYRFRETQVIQTYAQIKESTYVSHQLMAVRFTKKVLVIYKRKLVPVPSTTSKGQFDYYDKLYEVKINPQDFYYVDDFKTILVKKEGIIQVYTHIPQNKSRINKNNLSIGHNLEQSSSQHLHLINRRQLSLKREQVPSCLLFCQQFLTLFMGTSFGNVYEYLYPLGEELIPYSISCSSVPVCHIQLCAPSTSLLLFCSDGQLIQLSLKQYIDGKLKSSIYTLNNNNMDGIVKYQYTNRNYLIQKFTTIDVRIKVALDQDYDEVAFIQDKMRDDLQDITNKIKHQSAKALAILTNDKKTLATQFQSEFHTISSNTKTGQQTINEQLQSVTIQNQSLKQQMTNSYQKQILSIYKQGEILQQIKKDRKFTYNKQIQQIKSSFNILLQQQIRLKQVQSKKLQDHYIQISKKYDDYKKVAQIQVDESQKQLNQLKKRQIYGVQNQLKVQENKKQTILSKLGKLQKQMQRYRKRDIYFQNLIVQTRLQIQQLQGDIAQYNSKQLVLRQQLLEQEQIIQQKQNTIVTYLKNTNQMKKIKNVHEFELQQFERQVGPIQQKFHQVEKQVQKMNFQIMDEFNNKIQQNSIIDKSKKRIQLLKTKHKKIIELLHKSKVKNVRFSQQLQSILLDPFNNKIKDKLANVLGKFAEKEEIFTPNQELQKAKKQGEKLVRKKNLLRKAIQQQEKSEQCILRNKNQFFKYYNDNTNVVKQYNQLFKDNNQLEIEVKALQNKIFMLKVQLSRPKTPLRRTNSVNTVQIRKISQIKMTPFQRYQALSKSNSANKIKQSGQTRGTVQSSSKFLKSLIKDMAYVPSTLQQGDLIRSRIRTFVNPQSSIKKPIQKQLFQDIRQRTKSNLLKL